MNIEITEGRNNHVKCKHLKSKHLHPTPYWRASCRFPPKQNRSSQLHAQPLPPRKNRRDVTHSRKNPVLSKTIASHLLPDFISSNDGIPLACKSEKSDIVKRPMGVLPISMDISLLASIIAIAKFFYWTKATNLFHVPICLSRRRKKILRSKWRLLVKCVI